MTSSYAPADLTLAEVLERHRLALGGLATLEATAFHRRTSSFTGPNPQLQRLTVDERTGRVHVEAEVPAIRLALTKGFDGRVAWETGPIYNGYYGPDHPETLQFSRDLPPLWRVGLPGTDQTDLPELLGMSLDGRGVKCYVLQRHKRNGAGQLIPCLDFIDATAFLLREQRRGAADEELDLYDDYQTIAGRPWPFRVDKTDQENGSFVEHISAIEVLEPDDTLFRHPSKEPPTSESATANPDLAAFDTIWETLDNTFYDPTFGGLDWRAIREQYRPKAAALDGADSQAFVRLATAMLSELRITHCLVRPRDDVRTGEVRQKLPGDTGLDLRWIDRAAVIYEMDLHSPAARSALRPGFVVTALNGRDDAALRVAHAAVVRHYPNPLATSIAPYREELRVEKGQRVLVSYLDDHDRPGEVQLEAAERRPLTDPAFHAQRDGELLRIKFKLFMGDLAEQFSAALRAHQDARHLVLDLRGNRGGDSQLPLALAGTLLNRPASFGRFVYRTVTTDLSVPGSRGAYTGPIAILLDDWSASCTELFAGNLQELGRARIFGRCSLGAVLPAMEVSLPNGCFFRYPICNYMTGAGRRLEGVGVEPDDGQIELRRADLLKDRDPDLEAAVHWLTTRKSNPNIVLSPASGTL